MAFTITRNAPPQTGQDALHFVWRGQRQARRPDPEREAEKFKPQPGDVVVRRIPHTGSPLLVSVIGILHIYADDYYFMYENGEQHIMRFTFRNGDHILRIGQFTTKHYTWKYFQSATLHIYYSEEPDGIPGEWHLVAQQSNANPVQKNDGSNTSHAYLLLDPNSFELTAGDFIIHQELAVAPDRPWGSSYELRIVEQDSHSRPEESPFVAGKGDVVVRVRMSSPADVNHDAVRKVPSDISYEIQTHLLDHFVPMYVYGFLCVGKPTYAGPLENPNVYRWRYLGMDHKIFRDLTLAPPDSQQRKYDKCPLLPGCIIINLEETLNDYHPIDASRGPMGKGHILIYRSGEKWPRPPQDLPGSMVLQLGCFMSFEARVSTPLEIQLTAWSSTNRTIPGHPYACWCTVKPKFVIHDQLTRGGWIDAKLHQQSAFLPEDDEEALEEGPEEPDFLQTLHAIRRMNSQPPLNRAQLGTFSPTDSDIILNKGIFRDHLAMFSRHQKRIYNRDGKTYVEVHRPRNPPQAIHVPIRQHKGKVYNCFFWYPRYEVQDGDLMIRCNGDDSSCSEGKWVLSVQLYAYSAAPQRFNARRVGTWAFRGMDIAIFPPEDPPYTEVLMSE